MEYLFTLIKLNKSTVRIILSRALVPNVGVSPTRWQFDFLGGNSRYVMITFLISSFVKVIFYIKNKSYTLKLQNENEKN